LNFRETTDAWTQFVLGDVPHIRPRASQPAQALALAAAQSLALGGGRFETMRWDTKMSRMAIRYGELANVKSRNVRRIVVDGGFAKSRKNARLPARSSYLKFP
jgi:hypothetical protein